MYVRYGDKKIGRKGEYRTRAYSDSDAENYQEAGRPSHNFRLPPAFKHGYVSDKLEVGLTSSAYLQLPLINPK